jgi:hypothetical protein
MSLPVRLAFFALFVALSACDRDRGLLEMDLAAAEARLAEVERALQAGNVDTLVAEVDRRLPDGPRGALTASIAALFPGVEIDATLPEVQNGYVSTEPVALALPLDFARLSEVFDRVRTLGRVWQLDSVRKEQGRLIVHLHAFTFSGALQKLGVEVAPNEGTFFSKDRDHLRDRTRRVLKELEAKTAGVDPGAIERYWKAELKRSLLADLSVRMEKIEEDAALLIGAFLEAEVVPNEWTIGIRMGRRVCAIAVENDAEKKKIIAVAGSRPGVAIDAKERELVMKSGRVCNVTVGQTIRPPR